MLAMNADSKDSKDYMTKIQKNSLDLMKDSVKKDSIKLDSANLDSAKLDSANLDSPNLDSTKFTKQDSTDFTQDSSILTLKQDSTQSKNTTLKLPNLDTLMDQDTKAGFVAIIGRPNAGKSTLLNALLDEQIALVSHKINATRKRMNIIVMHEKSQIIFIDTPGIHEREKLLNQFMLSESLKAINDCDLVIFIASIRDKLDNYEQFLQLSGGKKHIVVLSKSDLLNKDEILQQIAKYEHFKHHFEAIIPISSTKTQNLKILLDEICRYLPHSPYLYDESLISTNNLREIYREKIREALFEYINQEIPYQSDVKINKIDEKANIDEIYANIIVEKQSQKIIIIGKNAATIKNIGICARKKIESLSGKKLFLKLEVVVKKGWSKDKKLLRELGYELE